MSFLKYLIYGIIGIGLGIAAGYAAHQMTAAGTPENFYHDQWAQTRESSPDSMDEGPLEVDEAEFDFGVVSGNSVQTHDFLFRNMSGGPVNIWCEQKSEGPVSIDLSSDKIEIDAGDSYRVTATLTDASEKFSQKFFVETDSPDVPKIELTLSGSSQ